MASSPSSAAASPRGPASGATSSGVSLQLKSVAQLAAPRGVSLVDELTGKAASY